ncbi:potassium uptake protein [Thomasclavelia cocleata]|uniref:Trk system potassium uptake protein TrkH n=2 Tax=Thomasclavelia cocleata TaxID=69824 RepID=A0A1I0GAZ9_9FIRM|nr:TrkH family potassium uptake protein [Thomasclavelia cocleata]MCR1960942.1 TrkH family potassium uptake protein [Thomasclavelia cocleata]NDO43387.1 potassium uptake protein [Thomasclavelia cocleata]PJN79656.1 potassium uptake protein [Thomasclavelia cocleata]SET67312.1 trk system potassium uptake protein TrkH [Thomasclavelia cocleata]
MKVEIFKKRHEHHTMRPTRQIALSFLAVILIGTILLSLPICNKSTPTTFLNNLFIATSATCVTGLVPVTTSEQFNYLGQLIIIVLIQIGGLGFLTFLNLLLIMIKKKISLTNKIVLQEALNQPSLNAIPKFLKNVIKYTFIVEGIGAILLLFVFVPEYGVLKGIYFAVFHAISAFCNAGFDVLGNNSLIGYQTNIIINLVIPGLIIMGGLGFIVWFDVMETIKKEYKKPSKFNYRHLFKSFSLHTKIVLIMTSILLFIGMILFYLCEFYNPDTIGKLNFFDQLQVSFFQSTTLRTAGFASVDIASLYPYTKFMMCIIMFIGGSPAGTAGGIKTVTFAISILMVYNIYHGRKEVAVFSRRIPKRLIIRSFAIITIGISLAFISIFILSISENAPFIDIMFEAVSAFATVGLSASLTPSLTGIGKIIIIILMYIGRIGPITLIISFARRSYINAGKKEVQYTDGNILLG